MARIIVHDHADRFVCDLDPAKVASAVLVEEVNGEHSLTITTEQELGKGDRLIVRDGMGTWHEYVVLGVESSHARGGTVLHEHYCVWSLQHDLSATYIDDQFGCGVVPGHASVPQTARRALECALEGTDRWAIGTISVTAKSSASFYRRSGWDGLKTVLERWGGELQATITVSTTGVVGRAVDLLAHVGATEATRRFDYGADLTGIKRTFADEVWPCRIVPLGKSSETEAGGYTRRPGIASVNGGVPWVQDDSMVEATRMPDGSGGWEYPTSIIKNDTYEDPADLLAWATEHVGEYTAPTVTYEASVAQFAEAGLDPHGVALGDAVAIVDRTFGEGGLRLMARVTKIKRDLTDPARAELTIGNADTSLAAQLGDISRDLAELSGQVASGSDFQSSSAYMDAIIARLNAEIDASGGYWYIVPNVGTRTYDVPVSDPAVGAEASKVVEVGGGNIRFATKDQAGNWVWRTIIENGLVVADNVKALNVNAGLIQSYDGSSFWDLDTGVFERNLVWEPIITEASLTTQYNSSSAYGTASFTPATGERYVVFFTLPEPLEPIDKTDAEPLVVNLASTNNFVGTQVISQRLVRSEGGAYRYVSVNRYNDTVIRSLMVHTTTDHDASTTAYPTYQLTDVRVYRWPSEGDGTIGFNIRSEDNVDTMTMLLSGGGLRMAIGEDETVIMPGEIDMTSLGNGSMIKFDPTNAGAKIRYDAEDQQLVLGNRIFVSANSSGSTISGPMLTPATGWQTRVSSQADVFVSVASGVTISRAIAVRWGPFVYLFVSGTISGTINLTNGYYAGSQNIGTLKADLVSCHPLVSGGTDTYTTKAYISSGSYSGQANISIARLVGIGGYLFLGSPPSSVTSVSFRFTALYPRGY